MADFETHFGALARHTAASPGQTFLTQPDAGDIKTWTFAEALEDAARLAAGLRASGLAEGDRVALLSKNCAEWVIADCAIAMAGLISVPIYPTAGKDTIAYVLEHSGAKAFIVGRLDNPAIVEGTIPTDTLTISMRYPSLELTLDWQALIDGNEPLADPHDPAPDDTMTILYTSGSTGRPKGVVLTYASYHYACMACVEVYPVTPDDRYLSYLPLAHITERAASVGPAIFAGAPLWFVDRLETFVEDLKRARVTGFISVPRLWVQFQLGVHRKMPPEKLSRLLSIPILRSIVAKRIREQLGFADCKSFGTGSAPISPDTLRWYERIGIDISEGWGLSETCGLSCTNKPFRSKRVGTIGEPIPGTEMKIGDDGEILIRSPGVMKEYYRNADLTAEVFTNDGFFHTGDKGEWDDSVKGFRITGRVKDQFKSAKGKYVSPVPIEGKLSGNPLIEQVCVMGRGLKAPVAVVVLSVHARNESKDVLRTRLQQTMQSVNATLEAHEKMSHVVLVDDAWTIENELLTPTMKIKRDDLENRYSEALRSLGSETVVWLESAAA